ncbi:MAG: acylphosphatase [Phycisphaeraceae bacterium]|nr:acylphosphatase [Phycisphaerales bacterium]MCB9860743.1 acylphosphatase [Phycisphaeraceae bacterium]
MSETHPQSECQRVVVFYAGTVQGVGFRATTKRIAKNHAVTGWVRNEDDGRVQLQTQGNTQAVDGFLGEIASTLAHRIETMTKQAAPVQQDESDFSIQRKLWMQKWSN